MSNAIDFRKLMRLEKKRLKEERSRSLRGSGFTVPSATVTVTVTEVLQNTKDQEHEHEHEHDKCPCVCPLVASNKKFNSILDDHKIMKNTSNKKRTNDASATATAENDRKEEVDDSLSDIYYIPNLLSTEYVEKLTKWLQSLPRIGIQGKNSLNTRHTKHTRSMDMDAGGARNDESQYDGKFTRLKFSQRNVALFNLLSSSTSATASQHTYRYPLLQSLCETLVQIQAFPSSHPPNHVLVNEYSGTEGILPHTDGPQYLDRTATFSIGGGDVLFNFTKRERQRRRVGRREHERGGGGGGINASGGACTDDGDNDDDDNNDDNDDDGGDEKAVVQVKLHGTGSLVVFAKDAYTDHCHSIQDRVEDLMEHAGERCWNAKHGENVKRGYRISLTFRHKYTTPPCRLYEDDEDEDVDN